MVTIALADIAALPQIPSPPFMALRFLEMASKPDCTIPQIAALVRTDPAVCAKLLKTVNSALYGLPREITSIDRALLLLGIKAVRSLVLGLSMTALNKRTLPDAAMPTFWRSSVASAVIARELALRLKRPDPEEDLVAGLLCDLGIVLLQQVYPAEYAAIAARPASTPASKLLELEKETLGWNHAEVGSFVLEKWNLPREITEAIRYHHDPAAAPAASVQERAHLLYFAAQVARLQTVPQQLGLRRESVLLARDRFHMGPPQLRELLEQANAKVRDFASIMEIDVGGCANYADVLVGATAELGKLILETNTDFLRVHQEKQQMEDENARLRETAERLREETFRDPLTGVYNRAYLDEALVTELRRARRRGSAVGLLFIDLDDFKHFNDRFGHAFGDKVLKDVATLLRDEVRGGDVVARYGGDEFCVLVTDTSEHGLQSFADRLLQRLNSLTIRQGQVAELVAASIGAVVCNPNLVSNGQLLEAADEAMYLAKTRGKNQVSVATLVVQET